MHVTAVPLQICPCSCGLPVQILSILWTLTLCVLFLSMLLQLFLPAGSLTIEPRCTSIEPRCTTSEPRLISIEPRRTPRVTPHLPKRHAGSYLSVESRRTWANAAPQLSNAAATPHPRMRPSSWPPACAHEQLFHCSCMHSLSSGHGPQKSPNIYPRYQYDSCPCRVFPFYCFLYDTVPS